MWRRLSAQLRPLAASRSNRIVRPYVSSSTSSFCPTASLFSRYLSAPSGSGRAEDEQIPYSGKSLAQTKEKQGRRYDLTIKYEASRPCDISLCWFYSSDSDSETKIKPTPKKDVYKSLSLSEDSTDWSDSETETENEVENIYMTEEEARAQIDKLLVGTKKEELYCYNPNIKYEPLKRYDVPRFAFSDDDDSSVSDTENGTMEDVEI